MHFNERNCHARECITNRNAGMRERRRIDNDSLMLPSRAVNRLNDFTFVITLVGLQRKPQFLRLLL